jgi:prepilin-type processing-associated H-X9-DG protein
MPNDVPPDWIVVFDCEPIHDGGKRGVLFADGRVEFLGEDEFNRQRDRFESEFKARFERLPEYRGPE